MSKVYIANFAGHDYTKLEKFGELKAITNGYVDFQSLDRIKLQVAAGIVGSDREDYLALSGASVICVSAALLWFCIHGKVRILNYDRLTKDYREMVITSASAKMLMKMVGEAT